MGILAKLTETTVQLVRTDSATPAPPQMPFPEDLEPIEKKPDQEPEEEQRTEKI